MNIIKTKLDGVFIIEPVVFNDDRGEFVKTFHKDTFIKHNMAFDFLESYYSTSQKGVIRGMHFQAPPQDHVKLVYVTRGSIKDVVLDLRKGSPTYGQSESFELSDKNHHSVYIGKGFAHGFLSLADDSSVTYCQTTQYSKDHDGGIRFDSFGFDWGVKEPIMSQRDKAFPGLKEFDSPFIYREEKTL